MSIATVTVFVGIILAFLESWYLVAVVLAVGLATLIVQWVTIDPPYVSVEDLHGARRNRSGNTSRVRRSKAAS